MSANKSVELGDQRRVTPERELSVNATLTGGQPEILQPLYIEAGERLEFEVC
jgi:hypothetical protein